MTDTIDTCLVTIGITSFNAVDTIERAIISASHQDWPETEIIIVDDLSTDGTFELLTGIQARYNNISIFQNDKNIGVAVSRNRIIKESKGEFIAFFDDDDESATDRITKQYNRIIQYEKTFAAGYPVICHSARSQVYPDGIMRYEPTMGMTQGHIAPHGEAVAERVLTGKPFAGVYGSTATCSQMARLSVYRGLSGFDNEFRRSEDTELNIRLSLSGGHFIGIDEPLVTQIMTHGSDKNLKDELSYTLQLLAKHKDFINKIDSYEFCCDWIQAKYTLLSGHKLLFIAKLAKIFLLHPIKTSKRLYWALPNIGFNVKSSQFYNEK